MFKIHYVIPIEEKLPFDVSKGQCYSEHTIKFNYNTVSWETITQNLLIKLSKDALILDSGCGFGRWVHYFKNSGYNIIGLECNKHALLTAKQYDTSIRVVGGDFLSMPFKNETFNTVISIGSYEHAEEGLVKPVKESHRILKNGGELHLVVPVINLYRQIFGHWLYRYNLLRFNFGKFKRKLLKEKEPFKKVFAEYRYYKSEVLKVLKYFNFRIIKINYEDFLPPRSLALLCDGGQFFAQIDKKTGKSTWDLNKTGLKLLSILRYLPKKWYCSNIHITCLKIEK